MPCPPLTSSFALTLSARGYLPSLNQAWAGARMGRGEEHPPCGEAIALLGQSLKLPEIDSIDRFLEVIRDKVQCSRDLVEAGVLHKESVDKYGTGNPWLLKAYKANLFPDSEGEPEGKTDPGR
jgi:hypothetical protein